MLSSGWPNAGRGNAGRDTGSGGRVGHTFFKRKPAADKVSVRVTEGVTTITIVLKYLSGGSIKPVQMTSGR